MKYNLKEYKWKRAKSGSFVLENMVNGSMLCFIAKYQTADGKKIWKVLFTSGELANIFNNTYTNSIDRTVSNVDQDQIKNLRESINSFLEKITKLSYFI